MNLKFLASTYKFLQNLPQSGGNHMRAVLFFVVGEFPKSFGSALKFWGGVGWCGVLVVGGVKQLWCSTFAIWLS